MSIFPSSRFLSCFFVFKVAFTVLMRRIIYCILEKNWILFNHHWKHLRACDLLQLPQNKLFFNAAWENKNVKTGNTDILCLKLLKQMRERIWYGIFFYMCRNVQELFSIAWFKRMGQKFKASRLTVTVKKYFIHCYW